MKNLKKYQLQLNKQREKMLSDICDCLKNQNLLQSIHQALSSIIQFYSIINMQNSQRQLFEQQIQLLRTQIQQQNKREEKLRQLIDTLTNQIQYQRDVEQQNFRLTQLNEKMVQGLKELKSNHSEQINHYDSEISKLKDQIYEKINEKQRYRIEFEKRQLVYEEKIAMIQSILEKKCHRVSDLEKKLHQESISRLKDSERQTNVLTYSRNQKWQRQKNSEKNCSQLGNSSLRVSHIENNYDENNMRTSNLSTMSKRSKASDFMKMDKSQMKIMMGGILKTKKAIENANLKCSQLEYKQNKTMLQ